MSNGSRNEKIAASIEALGIGRTVDIELIKPLSGGVSSDVFEVRLPDRTVCAKMALEQLRVAATWRAPLRRSQAECRWLEFAAGQVQGCVPRVLGYDSRRHIIVMTFLPPRLNPVWKGELFSGRIDAVFAAELGRRLAQIHAVSTRKPGLADRFANQEDFEALRLSPYLRYTGERHPALGSRLERMADGLAAARIALIHGDVSPKNILVGPNGPIFIDAECATFGDPAFDVAFCLNHLVIKAFVLEEHRGALTNAARQFWSAYRATIDWEAPAALDARAADLLPALMLARVDGKSPLEYLTAESGAGLRRLALELLEARPATLDAILCDDAVAVS